MKFALQIILSFLPVFASAQINNINIKANYNSIAFIDFVQTMEKEHPVKFYFDKTWVDSVIVKQTRVPMSLTQLLDDSFDGLTLSYLIDGSNIIITSNYIINSSLPKNFFTVENLTNDISDNDTIDLKYAFIEQAEKKEKAIDNKVVTVGDPSKKSIGDNALVSGIIRNEEDGQPIVGAQVYLKKLGRGTVTDSYGYYVITLPKGNNNIQFKYIGRKETIMPVMVYNDGILDVNMKEDLVQLREVVITTNKENNVKNLNVGVQRLNIGEIKQLPSVMGEVDIIKSATLLPGVQTVGEGASGFNVRGGSADQNLILFDEAPIFNSSHLFGFFSVFNPEIIKDFELYKSGIPARFGGRVSSVFDISAKQGNLKKLVVSGGISPITGKLTLEGPIIKDKLSVIIGGRSTYSNWVLQRLNETQFSNSKANFYDLSCKISYDIDKNNSLSLTGYQSKDYFKLNSDSAYHFENKCARLFFKHFFTKKFYGTLSAVYSNYQYNVESDKVPLTAFNLKYNIGYKSFRTDFYYFPNSKHTLNFGSEIIRYDMTPGNFTPLSEESDISSIKLPAEQGIESGIYINDEFKINGRLTVSGGLRFASFFVLGPSKVYEYRTDVSRSTDSRIDSTFYSTNEIVKTYSGPEVRLSARYNLGLNNSVKISYSRIHQFLHMLTNSTAISPTDVWKISDSNIKPLIGDQIAIGYYHNLFSNTIEASGEIYYKKTKNHLDYKSGAELILNPNLEVDLLSGIGRAYGIELLLKKKSGKLNGWISYTYSRSKLKVNGQFSDEKINNGEFYPADYDKPHDFNLVVNYKYSRRISFSNTFTYNTGRPITYPVAKYNFRGQQLIHYSNRNEYRIPDYMRWDTAINIEGNLKSKKQMHSSWSVGVYNVTGRNNVYSVFFKTTSRGVNGYQLSIFALPIFNVTYNFKF
jgi:hypothetical protein